MINQSHISTKNEDFMIFDLWAKYKSFWPWFVLSIFVCCTVAAAYVYITPKRYLRMATVMIKEDEGGGSNISGVFADKIVMSLNSRVKNELEKFQSPELIREVVRQLELTTRYLQHKRLREKNLYAETPVKVSFPDAKDVDAFKFQLHITSDSTYSFTKFSGENVVGTKVERLKDAGDREMYGAMAAVYSTPVGKVVITPIEGNFGSQWYDNPIEIRRSSVEEETRSFGKKLLVNLTSKDNAVIRLEITDSNIQRADAFLNTLIAVYDENWKNEKIKIANISSDFVNARLDLVRQELSVIDDELEEYKRQHMITDMQQSSTIILAQSNDYTARIMDANSQISMATYIRDYLKENNDISTILPANSGLNHQAIEAQITQYNMMLLERDALLANSSDKNPAVIDRNSKLQTTRISITQAVDNLIKTLQMQLAGYKQQEARVTHQIASNPGQERDIISIEREHKIKESLYLQLLEKKEENEMNMVEIISDNTRVISSASGSDIPVSPKKGLLLLVAFVIGTGIPGGVIWGKENLDTKIRGKSDLNSLSVPLLGVVALAEKEDQKSVGLLVTESGRDTINETFRMVRTQLDFLSDKDTKVIMFTSFEPSSGKTFISLNLAMTFALAEKKIALLDLDMRTAALSNIAAERDQTLGIRTFLNGNTSSEQLQFIALKDRFYTNFDVYPVGPIPPNPAELLMSNRFKTLIELLKTRYDYILMDCTPLDNVTDATIVGMFADLTVFIVREGHTDRRKLPELEQIYRRGTFKNMGLILNGSEIKIAFNKYHKKYNVKVTEAARQIRASDQIRQITDGATDTQAADAVKQLTAGDEHTQDANTTRQLTSGS